MRSGNGLAPVQVFNAVPSPPFSAPAELACLITGPANESLTSWMSDMLLGVGLLNGSTIWPYERMIMDCEIFGIIAKMMEGIVVDADSS